MTAELHEHPSQGGPATTHRPSLAIRPDYESEDYARWGFNTVHTYAPYVYWERGDYIGCAPSARTPDEACELAQLLIGAAQWVRENRPQSAS